MNFAVAASWFFTAYFPSFCCCVISPLTNFSQADCLTIFLQKYRCISMHFLSTASVAKMHSVLIHATQLQLWDYLEFLLLLHSLLWSSFSKFYFPFWWWWQIMAFFIHSQATFAKMTHDPKLGQMKLEKAFFPKSCNSQCPEGHEAFTFMVKSGLDCPQDMNQLSLDMGDWEPWGICENEVCGTFRFYSRNLISKCCFRTKLSALIALKTWTMSTLPFPTFKWFAISNPIHVTKSSI